MTHNKTMGVVYNKSRIHYLLVVLLFAAINGVTTFQITTGIIRRGVGKIARTTHQTTTTASSSLRFSPLDSGGYGVVEPTAAFASVIASSANPTTSTVLIAGDSVESWRQYVPLIVSLLVIVDILLGSPFANTVLGIVRAAEKSEENGGGGSAEEDLTDTTTTSTTTTTTNLSNINTKGERIDSENVAIDAIEKAKNTLMWNAERERLKTDEDRMEDIRRKMDNQLREFDQKKQQKS